MSTRPSPALHRRPATAALALALALVTAACGDDDTASAPSTTAEAATPAEATSSTTMPSTTTAPEAGAAGTMDLPTDRSTTAEAGTYNLAAIGLPRVTFETDDGPWHFTKVGSFFGPGTILSDQMVILSSTQRVLEGRRNLLFSRPTHLLDPTFIGPPLPEGIDPDEDLVPVAGIDAWLTAAETGGEWGVTDVESVEVSGMAATRFALEPDFVGCENMEVIAPGIRGDWTGCNGLVAWDIDSEDGLGRISVEGWDGGRNEYLWIHDTGDGPLVVSLHLGYDLDEDWNARARAVLESVTVV